MKKLLLLIVLLLVVFSLTSCSVVNVEYTGLRVGCVHSENDGEIKLSCMKFNGGVNYTVNVKEDKNLYFDSLFTVKNGTVALQIIGTNGEALYSETITSDSTFRFDLKEYGKNKIKLEFTEFEGEYSFKW